MKVLVISYMYPSRTNSVLGIFVHKQVQKLKENNCEVKVICPIPFVPKMLGMHKKWSWYVGVPKKDVIDGIEVYYPRYIDFPKGFFIEHSGFFMFLGIRKLVKNIYKNYKFDIIHSHVSLPVGFAGMMVNKKYKVPHVVTIHGTDFQYTLFKNKKCKENIFKVLKSASKIVAVSNKLKNVIKDEDFGSKIEVINNGINPEEHKGIYLEQEDVKADILSVSLSLIKTKGIDINIKAIALIKDKYPNIKYYIIGSSEEEKYLKDLVNELNLDDNVVFLGKRTHEEAMGYMDACKIFSLPSWLEGFGIVYIEAMTHGKPVIAVRGQGIEDVIINGENGFLVKPNSVEDVAKTIDYLMSNPKEAKKIGDEGKKTVMDNLTWNKNAQKNIKIYEELLRMR